VEVSIFCTVSDFWAAGFRLQKRDTRRLAVGLEEARRRSIPRCRASFGDHDPKEHVSRRAAEEQRTTGFLSASLLLCVKLFTAGNHNDVR
jgi:hypothetical protein